MRVKVLVNLGADLPHPFKADSVHDVPDDEGALLIGRHWAVLLPDAPVADTPTEAAPAVDKFEKIRQHPDHLQSKPSPRKPRAPKTND